ncbi:formylglycine-generating enzyme family protein [Symbioplanes lichenis]|uniref:formylglycine-generating enzyme family protein n=1 Tax=Symbioplanes lichenis TaxID=1629072 RepID=UPI00273922E1|nr:SUMF1/EgtB/PvdO family nonheme iron enzyme [Actinoplanes lichenis]
MTRTHDPAATQHPPLFTTVDAGRFDLATCPTTVAQYWHYLLDQGLDQEPAPRLHAFPRQAGTGLRTDRQGRVTLDDELSTLPATGVTWHGAVAYCTWLGALTGTHCRLPSAAEWQRAASGPRGWRWSLGNEFDRPLYAPEATGPRPVTHLPAGPTGLRGMTGNVFEWCSDPLASPDGPVPGSRAVKGGAYTLRNPESFENGTTFTSDALSTLPYIGFRVLRERRPR